MIDLIATNIITLDVIYPFIKEGFEKSKQYNKILEDKDIITENLELDGSGFKPNLEVDNKTLILIKDAIFYLDSRRSMSRQVKYNNHCITQWHAKEAHIIIFCTRDIDIDKRVRTKDYRYEIVL